MTNVRILQILEKIGQFGGKENITRDLKIEIARICGVSVNEVEKVMLLTTEQLQVLLGANQNVICGLFPAEDDDSEDDSDEESEEEPENSLKRIGA